MAARLFLPESRLEAWIAEGRAELFDAGIRLADEGIELALESAFHILGLVEGHDLAGLVGTVKSEARLRELGAELLGTAVVLEETAYETTRGFLVVRREENREENLDETRAFPQASG